MTIAPRLVPLPLFALGVLLPQSAAAATVDLGWAVDLVAPFIETALVSLAALAVGWLAARIGRWIGIEIDRGQAEALHGAVARGLRHAVSIVRSEAKRHARIDVESRLIAETAIYLEDLMPDALAHFGLTDEALDRLIRAHLGPDLLHWVREAQATPAGASER